MCSTQGATELPSANVAKLPITVMIAAKNERANIASCLESFPPIQRVIVLDSHSSDGTAEEAARRGVEVIQFDYHGGYPKKRQWALDHLEISTPWVLLLDADESLTAALIDEISS